MTKDELKELGANIAESLVELSLNSDGNKWKDLDNNDYLLGDLAKFMTLKNVYLEREEYEKIIPIQIKLDELGSKLDLDKDDYDGEERKN